MAHWKRGLLTRVTRLGYLRKVLGTKVAQIIGNFLGSYEN